MFGIRVTVPVACFRKGLAREYLETEPLPPPSTCYGFLLSLIGETNRQRHIGCRIAPVLIGRPHQSVVLRTVWRCKDRNYWVDPLGKHHVVSTTKKERDAFITWVRSKNWEEPDFVIGLGCGTNARPDYQQLLSPVELVIWLDSSEEQAAPHLEHRVRDALANPANVARFGGLSLGESTHLVDEVNPLDRYLQSKRFQRRSPQPLGQAFLLADRGRLTLPVWVDHVGSAGTRHVTGDLQRDWPMDRAPEVSAMPLIQPTSGVIA